MTGRYVKYIAFEGIDGSGKTTQLANFSRRLEEMGVDHVVTREPGSPHIGLNVREFLLSHKKVNGRALELLFQADRAEHTAWVQEQLAAGKWVLSDRSYISGLAYAMSWGHELPALLDILKYSVQCRPDEAIFLNMPVKSALKRVADKGSNTREEARGPEVMMKIDQAFRHLMHGGLEEMGWEQNFINVDARGSNIEVGDRIWCMVFPPNGTPC